MQEPIDQSGKSGPPLVDDALFPGIPGYRFQRRLGSGGMATVYLAIQESLDRPVAIKVTEPDALKDEISKQRFENEARTIARLSHSGIVGIHEVGRTSDGRMYYIMPYLANGDLAQRDLRNDEAQIREVLRTLLMALGYAHGHGIVHRDVKEENVLFDVHDRPQLTDFGIAISKKRDTSRLTSAGLSVGSSGYMAPEQARGEEVDGRADLYSVGVLAFSLLTGELPYRAPDALALALMHANDAIPRLPQDKRHWQDFIDRAMAKSPLQRFNNAPQMLLALDRIGRSGAAGKPVGAGQLGKLLFAGALLVAAGGYALHTWFAEPTIPETPTVPTAKGADTPKENPKEKPATPPPAAPPATPPEAAKPATKPVPAPAEQPAKPAPEKPADEIRKVPRKIKNWASRLFRRH